MCAQVCVHLHTLIMYAGKKKEANRTQFKNMSFPNKKKMLFKPLVL